MGDYDPKAGMTQSESILDIPANSSARRQFDSSAFRSQLEGFSQPHIHANHIVGPYNQQAFDMGAMAGALPQLGLSPMSQSGQYGHHDGSGTLPHPTMYHLQQPSQYAMGRNPSLDPMAAARAHQQQFFTSQYPSIPHQSQMVARQQMHTQPQGQFNQLDPYGFGINTAGVQQLDPRFASQGLFGASHSMAGDMSKFSRRASEPAPVPSYPRGPPRKPKQSGHALFNHESGRYVVDHHVTPSHLTRLYDILYNGKHILTLTGVGNLPPAATVTDLKDHFARDATKDIESLFLISKSNCAFVNYRSESACVAAMNRFHDSRFHGVRLVCRLRRGAANGTGSASSTPNETEDQSANDAPAAVDTLPVPVEPLSPTIVGNIAATTTSKLPAVVPSGVDDGQKVPEKFFVVKSLTVQDLEASVRNGIWATQSHNESALNCAYEEADNVYLIFSANKSGEYFGYARMNSAISGEPVNLSSATAQDETRSTGAPQSIPTAATATAPRGRIIDDSARGTIFWEAQPSDEDDEESPEKEVGEGPSGQNWGRQFAIEWMSTQRLPFYRTRGLRNPWNANREVKIARDGTEIEPSVGRRLVQMFHRPSPGPPAQTGMPFP